MKVVAPGLPIKKRITADSSATGSAIWELVFILSLILQPNDWVAAIVVSEMRDKLSPNIAPQSNAAPIRAVLEYRFTFPEQHNYV